jgi:hypothetical protein
VFKVSDTVEKNERPVLDAVRKKLSQKSHAKWEIVSASKLSSPSDFDEVVPSLLNLVIPGPQRFERLPVSKEVEILHRFARTLIEAEEEGILTESEAEAVLKWLAARFVSRRLDKTLEMVTDKKRPNWFLAASRYSTRE